MRDHTPGRTVGAIAGAGLAIAALATGAGAMVPPAVPGVVAQGAPSVHAAADPDRKIMVSLQERRLWLVENGDTVFTAPIAIGKGGVFTFAGRRYEFHTPTGQRRILAKLEDPDWVPPDWHYYEKAVARGLEPVHLEEGDRYELSDSTFIEVRGNEIGRINRWGYYHPFTPGSEIIFDDKIFIPPLDSPQRKIPDALGPVKLSLGDGYLIHGTHRYNQQSIGEAASHGCIRMNNEDVAHLAGIVDVGTPVVIY
ncbi:MAG: L,D-transpeptidase [Gemmatimonadota bacterium]|jgi:hypothetical protein